MLVRVCEDIFSNPSNDSDLDNLLSFFRLGKHQLVLNDPNDFLAFNDSTWKKHLKGGDLRLIKKGLISTVKKKEIVISEKKRDTNFSLKEAHLYLDQPLVILVENKQFEPPFINSVIKNFDSNEIENAHKQKWRK